MHDIKRILKAPIRKTLIVLLVSLLVYMLLVVLDRYFTRVLCMPIATHGSCRGPILTMFSAMLIDDFAFLARVITELSLVVLIAQFIYRLTRKLQK